MRLSIVVPTYNVENFLANCLNSLLHQDLAYDQYEILVINDGSTDKSAAIADSYAQKYEPIRVIHQANQGLSGARNTGIKEAVGKYIYFIDSDDYIARDCLGFLLDLMDRNKLELLGLNELETNHLDIHNSSNLEESKSSEIEISDGISYVAKNNYINNAWWYIINREYLTDLNIKFPLGRYVEDANFTATLLTSTNRMAFLPLDFYRYYLRPGSIMRKKNIDHIRKLLSDYELNIKDFIPLINKLEQSNHPLADDCLSRVRTRQESFAFFLLIKAIRYGIPLKEILQITERLKRLGVYPIHNFVSDDYNKFTYKVLLPVIHSRFLLSVAHFFWRLIPVI